MNTSAKNKKLLQQISLIAVFLTATLLHGCQSLPGDSATNTLAAIQALPHPEYDALSGHKAQAVSYPIATSNTSDAESSGWFNHVADQPNPVVAAMQALAGCKKDRAARTIESAPCELRRRGNTVIHSGRELSSGLADDREAFIWRVWSPQATAYIAGSIHVLKATLGIPPSYTEAFNGSNVLVLELDRSAASPEEMAQLVMSTGMLPDNQTLDSLLSEADMKRVNDYASDLGIPGPMVARMQPAMLLLQASVLEYMAMGYQGELGVESVFEAQQGNRAIVGLETIEAQLRAATALPLDLQAQLLMETLDQLESSTQEISELIHAWLAGDSGSLDKLFNNSATESPAAQQWLDDLLIKRNVGMAKGIAGLLNSSSNKQHFVLVGAAHLVGEESVIELLQQQGFKAQQLRNNSL